MLKATIYLGKMHIYKTVQVQTRTTGTQKRVWPFEGRARNINRLPFVLS